MPAAALNENSPGDVTQSVAPSQLRHEYALPKTDRWDDETGSERPNASLKGPLFCSINSLNKKKKQLKNSSSSS